MSQDSLRQLHYTFRYSFDVAKESILRLHDFDWGSLGRNKEIDKMAFDSELLIDLVANPPTKDPEWSVDMVYIRIIDAGLINNFLRQPTNKDLQETLAIQLSAATAIILNEGDIDLYTPKQVKDILSGQISEFTEISLMYTLKQAILSYDYNSYKEVILPYLEIENVINKKLYTWSEAVTLSLMLQLIWRRFAVFTGEDQAFLLVNYFYRAIVSGVQVREYISSLLYESPSIIDYVFFHELLTGAIDQNQEKVSISTTEDKEMTLLELIKKYESQVGDDLLDGLKQRQFIDGIYGEQAGRDIYALSLQEVLFITTHLKRARLVEEMAIQEKTEYDKMQGDLVHLFHWFFDKNLWSNMADYFQQKESLAKLSTFLWYCTYIYNLDQEEAINRFVDFANFLRENNLLKKDQEIIEFHEDDKKFHWNEEVVNGE